MAASLLLTGFEPFGAFPANASEIVVRRVGSDAGLRRRGLATAILPVGREASARALLRALATHRPRYLVLTGQAAGRSAVGVERIAVNAWRAPGERGTGRRILAAGPDGIFATLPLEACVRALHRAGLPAVVSESAGTYACNLTLYRALLWAREGRDECARMTGCGFIHLPPTAECLPAGPREPCLAEDALVAGIAATCAMLLRRRPASAPAGAACDGARRSRTATDPR